MTIKKEFYWILYSYSNHGGELTFSDDAINIHPFKEIERLKEGYNNIRLLNWGKITAKEYDLYHS